MGHWWHVRLVAAGLSRKQDTFHTSGGPEGLFLSLAAAGSYMPVCRARCAVALHEGLIDRWPRERHRAALTAQRCLKPAKTCASASYCGTWVTSPYATMQGGVATISRACIAHDHRTPASWHATRPHETHPKPIRKTGCTHNHPETSAARDARDHHPGLTEPPTHVAVDIEPTYGRSQQATRCKSAAVTLSIRSHTDETHSRCP